MCSPPTVSKIIRDFCSCFAIAAMVTLAGPARAQTQQQDQGNEVLQRIEALVNDEIISAYDLRQRMGLVIAATGGVNSEDELMRLRDQVLRGMVDEKLQLQEAAQFEVKADPAELQQAYERISRSFNQSPDTFEQYLKQIGSSRESLYQQLQAEFVWQTLVNGRLGSQVIISDEEVEDTIARLESNAGKFEYDLAEIYLIVDQPSFETTVRRTADRLVQQLRDGAQFAGVARQFSAASTAARGGELGWVSQGQMLPEIESVVEKMSVGDISEPIRSAGGFYIISLMDRRRILSIDPLDAQLDVTQVYYQFKQDTTQEILDAYLQHAVDVKDNFKGCDNATALAEELGATDHGAIGSISLRDMPPQLRRILEDLEIGEPSGPVASPDGVRIFYVCAKHDPVIQAPTFEEVMNQLTQQRLAMMARRYLRDLRRDAVIDIR